jgi:hypothetical protein
MTKMVWVMHMATTRNALVGIKNRPRLIRPAIRQPTLLVIWNIYTHGNVLESFNYTFREVYSTAFLSEILITTRQGTIITKTDNKPKRP